MDDPQIHHLMTQSGCGGTLTPAVRRFAQACAAAGVAAERERWERAIGAEMPSDFAMKDHEKRELVSRITAVALEYHAAEQLRERIGEAVLPAIDAAVAAERNRCAAKAGEYAQAWWSKHCASNKHMETTRAAHDDFCRLQAEIRRA